MGRSYRFVGSLAVLALVLGSSLTAQTGTRLDEFGRKLRLNEKTQVPAVEAIFLAASTEAAVIAQEMVQRRQTLVNAALADRPAEFQTAVAAYVESATKMAGLETAVFQKVYALLTPAQHPRAAEAFAFMAGFFQSAAGGGGRGGRGRG